MPHHWLWHLTTCFAPTGYKWPATHLPTRRYWQPNFWAKQTLAAPVMPSYALTLRHMPPGLREHVGNPAIGDVQWCWTLVVTLHTFRLPYCQTLLAYIEMYKYGVFCPLANQSFHSALSHALAHAFKLQHLYSKFWEATVLSSTRSKKEEFVPSWAGDRPRGFQSFSQYLPFRATISPQTPPTLELRSNNFQRW